MKKRKTYPGTRLRKQNNISRVNNSFVVRVQRDGAMHGGSFADSDYGGKTEAYNEAIKCRDRLLESLGETDPASHLHRPTIQEKAWHSRTRTGVKGLGFSMKQVGGSSGIEERTPHVMVYWKDDAGNQRQRSISVDAYGLEDALKMATNHLWTVNLKNDELGTAVPMDLYNDSIDNFRKLLEEETADA